MIETERLKRGLSKAKMADLIGMSERMYGYYIKGDYDGQTNRIQKYLDKLSESSEIIGVPIYDMDFTAGDVIQFTDFQEKVIGYIDLVGFKKCIAFVKVKGNSMFPTFTAGDLVGLEPQHDISIIEYGQPFGIVTKSGQSLIKIIRKGKDNDNLILRSNNKEFDDIDLKKSEILRLYKAHGPVRDSHY